MSTPSGPSTRGDVVGVIGGDEDVHVDVDGGARLGVVHERERPAECVGDAARPRARRAARRPCRGATAPPLPASRHRQSIGEQQQVAQRLAPLDRGRATPRRRGAHGIGHAGVGLDRFGERRRQRGRRLVPGAYLGEQRAGGGVGGRRAHGDGGTGAARGADQIVDVDGDLGALDHVRHHRVVEGREGGQGAGAGPRGVARDSRTSNRPPGRSTTNAIVGTLPTMPAIYHARRPSSPTALATRARRCRCRCPRRC